MADPHSRWPQCLYTTARQMNGARLLLWSLPSTRVARALLRCHMPRCFSYATGAGRPVAGCSTPFVAGEAVDDGGDRSCQAGMRTWPADAPGDEQMITLRSALF